MKFVQYEKDGSCDIIFEDHEIETIKKQKKLHFPSVTFKHFTNVLTKMVMDWNINFNDKLKKLQTNDDTPINGE